MPPRERLSIKNRLLRKPPSRVMLNFPFAFRGHAQFAVRSICAFALRALVCDDVRRPLDTGGKDAFAGETVIAGNNL